VIKKTVAGLVLGLVSLLGFSAPARAQAADGSVVVAAGLGVVTCTDCDAEKGFGVNVKLPNFSASDKFALAPVGDFMLTKGDGFTTLTFLGGVRGLFLTPNRTVTPFVEGVIGAWRYSVEDEDVSFSDLLFGPGVGVDIKLSDRVNARAQAQFLRVKTDGDGYNAQKYLFGISFRP
jgi:hypothetical protein